MDKLTYLGITFDKENLKSFEECGFTKEEYGDDIFFVSPQMQHCEDSGVFDKMKYRFVITCECDSGATTKITINNRKFNKTDFEEKIMMKFKGDGLDDYRSEYNRIGNTEFVLVANLSLPMVNGNIVLLTEWQPQPKPLMPCWDFILIGNIIGV